MSKKEETEQLLALNRSMLLIRIVEESLIKLFSDSEVPGFIHLSLGQEAVAAGVMVGSGGLTVDKGGVGVGMGAQAEKPNENMISVINMRNHFGEDSSFACVDQATSIGLVRNNGRDAAVEVSCLLRFDERLQVATLTGDEDDDVFHFLFSLAPLAGRGPG